MQIIEAWWGILRKWNAGWWMSLFKVCKACMVHGYSRLYTTSCTPDLKGAQYINTLRFYVSVRPKRKWACFFVKTVHTRIQRAARYVRHATVGACRRTSNRQEHKTTQHAGPEQDTIFHLHVTACRR